MNWDTIESDPGVFSELIAQLGIKGVQVEELYDLEKSTFDKLKPVFGLIFLFKWQKEKDDRPVLEDGVPGLYFAQQTVSNACATQAILNILLNRPEVDIGTELSTFKEFTKDLPADMRGEQIGAHELIRQTHNSFARPEPFVSDEKKAATDDDDVYHFVGYVPVDGALYELDGLKPGPILLGECTADDWLDKAKPAIEARIQKYSEKEIRFNLLAVVKNRKEVFEQRLARIQARKARLEGVVAGAAAPAAGPRAMDTDEDEAPLPATAAEAKEELAALQTEERELREEVAAEDHKFAQWRAENVRRKHNYVPFVYHLVKYLAAKGQLAPLIEAASKAASERQRRADAAAK